MSFQERGQQLQSVPYWKSSSREFVDVKLLVSREQTQNKQTKKIAAKKTTWNTSRKHPADFTAVCPIKGMEITSRIADF